jgi:hypothetical protein
VCGILLQDRGEDYRHYVEPGRGALPLRPIQTVRFPAAIGKFIYFRRQPAYPQNQWKSGASITWLLENDCRLLGAALELAIVDNVTEIPPVACPGEFFPFLEDTTALPVAYVPKTSVQIKRIG